MRAPGRVAARTRTAWRRTRLNRYENLANEQQSSTTITNGEIDWLPALARNRVHRDAQKRAQRLIEVAEAESRADFGRTKRETQS